MAQILMPQREQPEATRKKGILPDNALGIAGGVAGGIAGAVYGGPMGAIQGASAGQALGSTAQGYISPVKYNEPSAAPQIAGIESNGMERRMSKMNDDPVQAISRAKLALQGLPPDVLPETRRSFENALELAKRNQIIA